MSPQSLSTSTQPWIIAHRGASGAALENSLEAFRIAIALGVDGIELDFHATRDGELVVHHDPCLPDGRAIAELEAAEVARQRLADGSPAPTVAEVLRLEGDVHLHLEAKGLPAAADAHLLELIAGCRRPDRIHVHGFDHRLIARLHRQAPTLSLGVLSASMPLDPVGPVVAAGAVTLWQEFELIDAELISRCGAAGIKVIAWTVNEVAISERLGRLGVAGLCGNWPERLRVGSRNVEGAP
ncbi:MAG: glycerophosphodiester phosphodiesterase [Gemmatimonadota bacterium]